MSREIKFRVFDQVTNEMYYPGKDSSQLVFGVNLLNWSLWSEDGEICNGRDEASVMQYTGTTDCKGREIFEGDIVKRYFAIGRDIYDPVSLGFVDHEIDDEGYFIGVVSYRPSEGFVLNQCKKYDIDYNLISKRSGVKIHAQYAEVIGNIYENPELMVGDENGQTR